jgi:hypothetical protein
MRPTMALGISARFDSNTDSNASTCCCIYVEMDARALLHEVVTLWLMQQVTRIT